MKKIIMCLVLLGITSCKKNIDNCGCKFNLDIIIKNPDVYNEKYLKFYDENYVNKCFENLKKGKNTTIKDAYLYYHKKCPNYNLEHIVK